MICIFSIILMMQLLFHNLQSIHYLPEGGVAKIQCDNISPNPIQLSPLPLSSAGWRQCMVNFNHNSAFLP